MLAWATPATAITMMNMAATPKVVTMPIMIVIMGTPSATSALAVVGLATITIPVTACFCSTMRAVVIRCANSTAVIGAKGGIIGIASIEAVTGVAGGAIKDVNGATPTILRLARMAGVTDTTAARAAAMIIYAKAGVKIVAMAHLTAGKAQMANGAAVAAVRLSSLLHPILMLPKTEAEAEGRTMATHMGGPTGEAAGIQTSTPFRRLGGGVPKTRECCVC